MRTPHFNFIQPIGRSLKVQPPLENPKSSTVSDIFSGTRDIGNFVLKATVHAHPHSDLIQPINGIPSNRSTQENNTCIYVL